MSVVIVIIVQIFDGIFNFDIGICICIYITIGISSSVLLVAWNFSSKFSKLSLFLSPMVNPLTVAIWFTPTIASLGIGKIVIYFWIDDRIYLSLN